MSGTEYFSVISCFSKRTAISVIHDEPCDMNEEEYRAMIQKQPAVEAL
jgi:hypothetical protein